MKVWYLKGTQKHSIVYKKCTYVINNYVNISTNLRSKSGAAAGLCSWVINIVGFYEVYCDVEPKRRALEEANAELKAAETKLAQVKAKVIGLQNTLAKLTADYQKAVDEKVRCQEEADATTKTIQLANRLVGGLASEKVS